MTGAEIIIGILEREGITTVAGIPGGANLPLYDALGKSGIRHVLARHEQAAGFMAQGMARRTGKVAVCFATSGPGATNLLTAVADAKLDSIPLVAITGQVPRAMIGTDAFQEIDTFGLSLPITKHSTLVRSAAELFDTLPKAFRIARSGRPGPVLIDVPKDVFTENFEFVSWPEAGQRDGDPIPDGEAMHAAIRMIAEAKRPVIYAGAGCADSDGSAAVLSAFVRKTRIPVALTLRGLGAFDPDDSLYLGMLGMHGTRAANTAIAECDLLIALGARFDDRATGKLSTFAPLAQVIHVEMDSAELGKLRRPTVGIHSDAGTALHALTEGYMGTPRPDWERRIADLKARETDLRDAPEDHPARIIADLFDLLPLDAVVTTDVGQHQMWAAQAVKVRRPRSFLTSSGLGTMGFGLPAAIGAALAEPERTVYCITGDGSLLMNIQEFATLSELGCNVKVLIMDNGRLGLVRQQQELFYKEHFVASQFYARPDFAAVAAAFGLPTVDLGRSDTPSDALAALLAAPGPAVIRIPTDELANVYPMVPPGAANVDAIGTYVESEYAEEAYA